MELKSIADLLAIGERGERLNHIADKHCGKKTERQGNC